MGRQDNVCFDDLSIDDSQINMSKRKQSYTLEFKLKIIKEVDEGKRKKVDICKHHGIPNSTLSTILAEREKIEKASKDPFYKKDMKKIKTGDNPDVEKALVIWCQQARSMNVPLSGPIVMEKASQFAVALDNKDFKPNPGWLERFKGRYNISFRVISGESNSAPQEAAKSWAGGKLQSVLADFNPNDIFNADETGLYFQCLPNKTLSFKGESCSGGKQSKKRFTVLVAANMTGSEKLPLLVIGKSNKPRAFKNKTVPLPYKANKKAWMTADFFEKWLRDLDAKFLAQNRKVAMIVDNCTAHPRLDDLKAMELIFLPPNCTSVLQPCDQGIIKNMKHLYRKKIVKEMILHIESQSRGVTTDKEFLVDEYQALVYLRSAWAQVTEETIKNCFRHAGFKKTNEDTQATPPTPADDNFGNLFTRLSDLVSLDITAEAYADIDSEIITSAEMSVSDIVADIKAPETDEQDEPYATPEPESITTAAQARDALMIVRRFLDKNGSEKSLTALDTVQDFVDDCTLKTMKQSSIQSFFKKM